METKDPFKKLGVVIGDNAHAEKLYKSLFENSHCVMLLINPETGEIIDANSAACKYYLYSKEQISKMKILDINILSPQQVQVEMQNAKSEMRNYFNFDHKLASGEIRKVEVYSSPVVLKGQRILFSIIHDITERRRIEKDRDDIIAKLKKAQKEIKNLKGILPLCSFCKKIRNPKGGWEQVDVYIHQHSEADISHTVCPECMKTHYPD